MKLVTCSLHPPPPYPPPSLADVFTRDILDLVDNLEHSHTNSRWSHGEDITKQSPISSFSLCQFLLLAFQFGWMIPNLSQAPGPPPGVPVKLLSLCSQVMAISSQSTSSFTAITLTQDDLPFTWVISGVPLFTSFPSTPFPIQSRALLPHSNTFRGFPLPRESRKNISTAEFKMLWKITPSHVSDLTFRLFWQNSFISILSFIQPAPAFALLLLLPRITSCLLETKLFSQDQSRCCTNSLIQPPWHGTIKRQMRKPFLI